MSEKKIFTLQKEERLNSKIIIEKLFVFRRKQVSARIPAQNSLYARRGRIASHNITPYKRSEKEVQKSRKKKPCKKTDKRSLQEKQIHTEKYSGKGEQESRNSFHLAWKRAM